MLDTAAQQVETETFEIDIELTDEGKAARDLLLPCITDRNYFVRVLLNAEPDPWQQEIMADMDAGAKRISIRSGHGVGKTCFCAWLALHFLIFRTEVKIVVTSPSGSQLKDGLIPEVNLWLNRLPKGLGLFENIDPKTTRLERRDDRQNNWISFRTARVETPEAIAGIHADNVLVIVDEASGVPEPIYEAGSGTLSTVGAIIVLIGNPTRARGFFHRTQTKLADMWLVRRVSCFDSPRVDKGFIEYVRRTYGIDSNQYRVRVLGEFPTNEDDVVIPRELAESMLDREIVIPPTAPSVWGIDPGRGGDPTGFVDRCAAGIRGIEQWYDPDLMRIVGKIKSLWDRLRPSERPEAIYVDSIGIGAGIADRLRELALPCIDVNVSESPSMKDRFPRLRPELWFAMRDWLDARNVTCSTKLKYAEELVEELCQPEMRLLPNGKTDVETKKEMKSRGLPSPNLADALGLTFAHQGGAAGAGRYPTVAWNRPVHRRLKGIC